MPSGRRGGQFSRSAAKKGAGKTKRKNISDRKIVSDGSDGGKVRDPSGMSNPAGGSAYKRARVHPVVYEICCIPMLTTDSQSLKQVE